MCRKTNTHTTSKGKQYMYLQLLVGILNLPSSCCLRKFTETKSLGVQQPVKYMYAV